MKLKEGNNMLINLVSILLMGVFIYALVVNFRRGNFAYSFVMYVGAIIFYANFYHNLSRSWAFWLMLIMLLASISLAIYFIYCAIECQNNRHHYWGAVALSGLTVLLVLLFNLLL